MPTLRWVLPVVATSVALARRLVLDACQQATGAAGAPGAPGAPADDDEVADFVHIAVLLTSEVVTNAVVHGRSGVRLVVHVEPEKVTVEVGDDSSRTPQIQVEDDHALGGRGMTLVGVLADTWGVREEPVGKTVWFVVAAP